MARHFAKDLPNLTQVAYDKFVEEADANKYYYRNDAIRDMRHLMKNVKGNQAELQ